MTHNSERMRFNQQRAERLAAGDVRSHVEQVADTAFVLADLIEQTGDPRERFPLYGEALAYLSSRANRDWLYTLHGFQQDDEDDE